MASGAASLGEQVRACGRDERGTKIFPGLPPAQLPFDARRGLWTLMLACTRQVCAWEGTEFLFVVFCLASLVPQH